MQSENHARLAASGRIPNPVDRKPSCYTCGVFGFDPPDLSDSDVAGLAIEFYELVGTRVRLRGERSHNTLFTSVDGEQFVLRVAGPTEHPSTIDLHAKVLAHLEQRAPNLPVARIRPALNGELVVSAELPGGEHLVQLITFLPGTTFADDLVISLQGLAAVGELLGGIAHALADFDHPAADVFMPWDLANGLILDPELWAGLGSDALAAAAAGRQRLEALQELLPTLPRRIIHNDGHRGNLLRCDHASDIVTGVIDFGDLTRTVTAADLAVSGANFVGNQADPVAALAALTIGYHRCVPLTALELTALPDLVLARLTLSTLLTDYQIKHSPHIAEAVARERVGLLADLQRWLTIDPIVAAERIQELLC